MERGLSIIEAAGSADRSEVPRTAMSLAVPLVGSVAQTYGALWLMCGKPWSSSLTWASLVWRAVLYLVVTAAAHVVAVWLNRRMFREQIDAPAAVLVPAIWPTVVWLPLLVLLLRENSVVVTALVPVIAVSGVWSLRRWVGSEVDPARREAGEISSVFAREAAPALLRQLLPALAAAVAFQAGVGMFALGRLFPAGVLLGAGCVFPLWAYRGRVEVRQGDERSVWALAPRTLAVFALLVLALMPYLRSSAVPGRLRAAIGGRLSKSLATSKRAGGVSAGGSYSGVILLQPPKPKHLLVVEAAEPPMSRSSLRGEPVRIAFDGPYWYFKQPDERPRADATVVRGDPTKRSIRSTDMRPLMMEAHQTMLSPVRMDCCRVLRVGMLNAEAGAGAISVEVLLGEKGARRSLGSVVMPSSLSAASSGRRAAVEEVLSFRFPARARGELFDEITVVIRPAGERSRTGAHVAVQYFELSR